MSRAERWASHVLLAGGIAGVVLMAVGVLGAALSRVRAAETIVSAPQIVHALSHRPIDPVGVAALGIVTLCLTPFAAVACAGVAFYLDGDRRFAAIAAVVAALLLVSFWIGGTAS